MTSFRQHLLSGLLLFILFTNAISAENTLPEYDNIYVNDYAQILDRDAEERIRNNLIELSQFRQIQMTILTISSVRDYDLRSSIESFATRLFNDWGIGDAERNDGVLILIARNDRKMRIEIGSGYSKSWDSTMKKVIDKTFIPKFKENNYQSGIEEGVRETIYAIAGNYPGDYELNKASQLWKKAQRFANGLPWWAYTFFIVPFAWLAKRIRRYLRHRPKDCSICKNKMVLLNEDIDDEHLDGGQRLEEYLESIDYDVWQCHFCSHMQIDAYKAWFSQITTCPSCRYKTLVTESTVLESATTSRSGRKRLDYHCDNCNFSDTEYRTIPKISESSSSSSSGSSFGGGRSSGGGASGSW